LEKGGEALRAYQKRKIAAKRLEKEAMQSNPR